MSQSKFNSKPKTPSTVVVLLITILALLTSKINAQFEQDELLIISTSSSSPDDKDYFGASLLLINDPIKSPPENWLFIGAPKGNDPRTLPSSTRPGIVQRCKFVNGEPRNCSSVQQIKSFCTEKRGLGGGQIPNCSHANIGFTLGQGQGNLFICAPTQTVDVNKDTSNSISSYYTGGCIGMPLSYATNKTRYESCYVPERTSNNNPASTCAIMTIQTSYNNIHRLNGNATGYALTTFAGFSINVPTKGESVLLMGVPYWYDGTGGGMTYSSLKAKLPDELMSFGKRDNVTAAEGSTKTELLGFAITSGSYFSNFLNSLYVAITSANNNRKDDRFPDLPKGSAGGVGAVYIVTLEDFNSYDTWISESRYKSKLEESKYAEYGSYFGYALESVDVNGDGREELLVGAPYLRGQTGSSDYDVGQVTVFSFNQIGEQPSHYSLFPDDEAIIRKQDIRFGMAVAKIGDINQDGFQDVAIGAPFENSLGAVYLFCGSKQRLTPCDNAKLTPRSKLEGATSHWGFGYHIYGGVDIDDSNTPDVSVGWIGRDAVAVYRTRPKLNLSTSFTTNPATVKEDAEEFEFTISVTASLSQSFATSSVPLKTQLELQINVRVGPGSEFYMPVLGVSSVENKAQHIFTIKTANSQGTLTQKLLRNTTASDKRKDIAAPEAVIVYNVSYAGIQQKCDVVFSLIATGEGAPSKSFTCSDGSSSQTYEFCPNCPYPYAAAPVQGKIEYCPLCLEGTATPPKICESTQLKPCEPNITVALYPSGNFTQSKLTFPLDRTKSLQFVFNIENTGDKIRSSSLIFSMQLSDARIRPNVSIVSEISEAIIPFENQKNQIFSFKNLTGADFLGRTKQINFVIHMDSIKAFSTSNVEIKFTASIVTAENKAHTASLQYTLVPDGAVFLEGHSESRSLMATKTWPSQSAILRFAGKLSGSSLADANLTFLIPLCPSKGRGKISNGIDSTFILNPTFSRTVGKLQECSRKDPQAADAAALLTNLQKFNHTNHYASCEKAKFIYFTCKIVDYFQSSDFEITFRINLASPDAVNIINVDPDKETRIHAIGSISILGGGENHSSIAHAQVLFKVQQGDIPPWVIIVALAVGILCLSCLILGLYKCGFFKRKTKEELKALKEEMEDQQVQSTFPAAGADRYDDASAYCHDPVYNSLETPSELQSTK